MTQKSATDILLLHQQMHDDMDAVLGIAGNDYSIPPTDNRTQMETFYFQHADEHRQANLKLDLFA
ncbi:hypothetical protein KGP36_06185 [Patescibacteria group bacterium]|nr:hypothetical protein [Patescibacteria group bacterium]